MQKTPIPEILQFGDTKARKNPAAMYAYRCSVFGLLPVAALICCPIAIVFGIIGLRHCRANRKTAGAGHARIAIILGTLSFISNIAGLYCIARGQGWL